MKISTGMWIDLGLIGMAMSLKLIRRREGLSKGLMGVRRDVAIRRPV